MLQKVVGKRGERQKREGEHALIFVPTTSRQQYPASLSLKPALIPIARRADPASLSAATQAGLEEGGGELLQRGQGKKSDDFCDRDKSTCDKNKPSILSPSLVLRAPI